MNNVQKINEYILPSTPKMVPPNIEEVFNAEVSLRRALKKNSNVNSLQEGIFPKEAETILDWVVYNARVSINKAVVGPHGEDVVTSDLAGYCGFGQSITGFPLESMGLDVKLTNTFDCISPQAAGHAFLVVGLPVKEDKSLQKRYLIDTTFKQFLLSDRCIKDRFFSENDNFKGGRCTPDPGYFINFLDSGKEFASQLARDGYIELTPENAKIYGDAFTLTAKGLDEYGGNLNEKNFKTNIRGEEYIQLFEKHLVPHDYSREEFVKLGCNIETPYEQTKRNFCKLAAFKLKSATKEIKSTVSQLPKDKPINTLRDFKDKIKNIFFSKKEERPKHSQLKDDNAKEY